MKVCCYMRVSTEKQLNETQLVDLKKYCEANGFEYDIYSDKLSGTTSNRPELKRLLEAVARGEYKKLIVWRLDRFSRSLKDLITMTNEVQLAGCDFVSLKESIDFSTPSGKLQFQLLGAFAEYNAAIIRENTKAGIAKSKIYGTRTGNPVGGQARDFDLAKYRTLKSYGWKPKDIAKELGFSRSQMYERLKAV